MRILISIEDLRIGGAQTFALRLAQALHEAGHHVWLYTHYPTYTNAALVRQLAPDVPVLGFDPGVPGAEWLSRKLQGALRRLGRPFPVRERLVARHLRHTLTRLGVEVLNSHTIKSDYVAAAAASGPLVPLVITMHGCYEDFLHKPTEPAVIGHARRALDRAAGLVYLTDKNLEIFSLPGVRPLASLPHVQIYNGFAGKFSPTLPTRAQLGIGPDDLVFGMVARGIAEKGWQYALDSFADLSQTMPHAHLVLVGSSPYLDELQRQNAHPRVYFVGFAPNPIDWMRLCDVGLLPSYFASESLPNSVAEYLFCGIPVVATRIGEVPRMLAVPGEAELAGVLLAQNGQGLTQPAALTDALRAYAEQPARLARHKALARQAFDKFEMLRCTDAYVRFYGACQRAAGRTTP